MANMQTLVLAIIPGPEAKIQAELRVFACSQLPLTFQDFAMVGNPCLTAGKQKSSTLYKSSIEALPLNLVMNPPEAKPLLLVVFNSICLVFLPLNQMQNI